MPSDTENDSVRVLDEGDGVELLAYLVTAARTQVDEAAEYAPMRLLTAASRLAEMVEPNASARVRPLLRDIRQGFAETAVQAGDPAGYVERLDALCRTIAEYLVRSLDLDRSP
jgi:type VI protein secretion system component VasF